MSAHGHAAEGCQGKAKEQESSDQCAQHPVLGIFALKQRTVPLPVQDLMDNDEQRHTHADQFV